jgi:hypothetical protein
MTEGPLFTPPERPLPERLTVQALRQAIIDVLYDVKAYDLAHDCVFFGLDPPTGPDDRPDYSKRRYVDARVRRKTPADLLPVAEKIAAGHDDQVLAHLLAFASGTGGVRGELKNLIFAALGGPKPKIVLADALNNDLELTENSGGCREAITRIHLAGAGWASARRPPGGHPRVPGLAEGEQQHLSGRIQRGAPLLGGPVRGTAARSGLRRDATAGQQAAADAAGGATGRRRAHGVQRHGPRRVPVRQPHRRRDRGQPLLGLLVGLTATHP